jgi:hypothetical protein
MTSDQAKLELTWLLDKITSSEDFLERAEEFFHQKNHQWPIEVAASFEIFLERKREQIYFERDLTRHIGTKIALDAYDSPDI